LVIVMNVVHVEEQHREQFERHFLDRESRVHLAEGFAGFDLLRRDSDGEYIVLTRWESREAFDAWASSDLFKESHRHTESDPIGTANEVRHYEVIDTRVPA
jgi:heme oxygenase (mycobilin-producing)